jgi:hypothetical protein
MYNRVATLTYFQKKKKPGCVPGFVISSFRIVPVGWGGRISTIDGIVERDLLLERKLPLPTTPLSQTEAAPVVAAPLAEGAVGTRMLLSALITFHLSPFTFFQ